MGLAGAGPLWVSVSVWASAGMARLRRSKVVTSAATNLVFTSDL